MSTEKLDEAARLKAAYERNEFLNLHEIVAKARQNLNQNAWDYIVGGVETETTLRRNRMALDTVAFRPRVLRDVRKVDASTELLGRKLRLPIVLCPVGTPIC
jgi:isopentenyl diphosphate isomerase/L-lactate dehydrogenase-like FMN-dependent dehydrogenase